MSLPAVSVPCANCGSIKSYPLQTAAGEQVLHCPSCFLPFRVIVQDGEPVDTLKLPADADKPD